MWVSADLDAQRLAVAKRLHLVAGRFIIAQLDHALHGRPWEQGGEPRAQAVRQHAPTLLADRRWLRS
jgi:hypothetical protein